MHRQVGDLVFDENGLAKRGLLVRHLVMPSYVEEGKEIVKFLAENISKDTYINVMEQYRCIILKTQLRKLIWKLIKHKPPTKLIIETEFSKTLRLKNFESIRFKQLWHKNKSEFKKYCKTEYLVSTLTQEKDSFLI